MNNGKLVIFIYVQDDVMHLPSLYRLCLRDIVKQNSENLPCVLVKCDKDGKAIGSAPGLQVSESNFA